LHRIRNRIEPSVRRALGRTAPSWTREPDVLPWFDQPDALARIEGEPDAPLLRRWIGDGYVVVDDVVDRADVDAMVARLDGLWDAPSPVPHLVLLDLRDAPGEPSRNVPHAEVRGRARARRERGRVGSDWRIHGWPSPDASARGMFSSRRLRDLASRLFGRRARPFAAINFMKGSRQHLHQDMGVFHIYPRN